MRSRSTTYVAEKYHRALGLIHLNTVEDFQDVSVDPWSGPDRDRSFPASAPRLKARMPTTRSPHLVQPSGISLLLFGTMLLACGDSAGDDAFGSGSMSAGSTGSMTTTLGSSSTTLDESTTAISTSSDTSSSAETAAPPVLDLGAIPDVGTGGGGKASCEVADDMDGTVPCDTVAPPNSFEAAVQWDWVGDGGEDQAVATPLVGNLTDDNDDGVIDLCDTPDVVVLAGSFFISGHLYIVDGETGTTHRRFEPEVHAHVTPAMGDIDGDGVMEIVAGLGSGALGDKRLVAFDHDGTQKWVLEEPTIPAFRAVALADVDNDGDVEILVDNLLIDHEGNVVQTFEQGSRTVTAADLDGDDDMEIVMGAVAYHHDGSVFYDAGDLGGSQSPAIADLDGDGDPEIFVVTNTGFSMVEADGTVVYGPTMAAGAGDYRRAAALHDVDGDGEIEIAVSTSSVYATYEADLTEIWSAPVADITGTASGTAFDFLGDGGAEAMYGDESAMYVFGDDGGVLLETPRGSPTHTEYPVVADIDNDGSAEILVTSSGAGYALRAVRDAEDRWVASRRIWNQHSYHVTNVREDGTIPQVEPKSWTQLNTFRTNAQRLPDGSVCQPPEG